MRTLKDFGLTPEQVAKVARILPPQPTPTSPKHLLWQARKRREMAARGLTIDGKPRQRPLVSKVDYGLA